MESRFDTAKQAARLAFAHRKAIKNGDFTPFIPALAMAMAKDGLLDMVSAIPVLGLAATFLGLFITVYLFIFLFGKGKWKVRIIIFVLYCFDVIPVVGLIPLSTVSVLYAYKQAKKHADQAKKELAKLGGQTNAQRIREYQMAQAAQSTAEEQNSLRDGILESTILRTPEQKAEYDSRMGATLAGMERVRRLSVPPRTTAARMNPKMV